MIDTKFVIRNLTFFNGTIAANRGVNGLDFSTDLFSASVPRLARQSGWTHR